MVLKSWEKLYDNKNLGKRLNQRTSILLQEAKIFCLYNKKDLGMACHIPLLNKVKKQEMPLPSL